MALSVGGFLLTLAALSAASAPDCQELVQPYMPEEPEQLFGKWIYVMGAGDPVAYHKALEYMKSSWIELHPNSDNLTVTLRWGDYCFNRCIYGKVNATVSGLTATFRKNLSDHKGHLLQTCSNCLLWTDTFRNVDFTGRYIMQFTRTGKIHPQDVDHFKKQAKCLNFPEIFHSYDTTAGVTIQQTVIQLKQCRHHHKNCVLTKRLSSNKTGGVKEAQQDAFRNHIQLCL